MTILNKHEKNNSDIHPGAKIGKDTRIYPFVFIEEYVTIGDRCIIKPFVYIPNDTRIGNDVFIGMGTQICNDRYPIANNKNFKCEGVIIDDNVGIGANCTILPGVHIGKNSIVGAGSIITKDIYDNVIIHGDNNNVSKIRG